MKLLRSLTVLTVVFLVVSSAIPIIYGQTEASPYDFGDKAQLTADGRAAFAIGAAVTMATEPAGGWLADKTYQVNWTLRLDSATPQYLNGSDFYIALSWPSENVAPTIPSEVLSNQTQLRLQHKTGTLSAEFTPTNTSDGFFMSPEFPFTVYINGTASTTEWASGIWYGEGGVSTNIIDNTVTPVPSAFTPPKTTVPVLSICFAVLILVLVVLLTLIFLYSRKTRVD